MGNNGAEGSDRTDGIVPDPTAEEPPRQSGEPWRRAAEAWTQHAEAWAAQTEALAHETAARTAGTAAPPNETARRADDGGREAGWVPLAEPARAVVPPPVPTAKHAPPAVRVSPAPHGASPQDAVAHGAHPHVWQPRHPLRRSLVPLAGAAAFVLCLASASWVIWDWSRPEPTPLSAPPPLPPLLSVPAQPSAPGPALTLSAVPAESAAAAPVRPDLPGRPEQTATRPADALADWAGALRQLDIPPVALQAYGYAEAVVATAKPRCRLSWTLLAGIGAVESNHGRYGGATLRPDGTSSRPIIGVPLAGVGVDLVRDTDGGTLDGDRVHDRAIGPMQFLPETWRTWSVDGDGDGRADPYDIDDAALAAGYYLCAGEQNLASGNGWSSAVFSYNHVPEYVERVYEFADAYGRAS